jgi:hypothetical protein
MTASETQTAVGIDAVHGNGDGDGDGVVEDDGEDGEGWNEMWKEGRNGASGEGRVRMMMSERGIVNEVMGR